MRTCAPCIASRHTQCVELEDEELACECRFCYPTSGNVRAFEGSKVPMASREQRREVTP